MLKFDAVQEQIIFKLVSQELHRLSKAKFEIKDTANKGMYDKEMSEVERLYDYIVIN